MSAITDSPVASVPPPQDNLVAAIAKHAHAGYLPQSVFVHMYAAFLPTRPSSKRCHRTTAPTSQPHPHAASRILTPPHAADTGTADAVPVPLPSAGAVVVVVFAASIAPIGSGRERSILWIPSLSMRMQLKANLTVRPGRGGSGQRGLGRGGVTSERQDERSGRDGSLWGKADRAGGTRVRRFRAR